MLIYIEHRVMQMFNEPLATQDALWKRAWTKWLTQQTAKQTSTISELRIYEQEQIQHLGKSNLLTTDLTCFHVDFCKQNLLTDFIPRKGLRQPVCHSQIATHKGKFLNWWMQVTGSSVLRLKIVIFCGITSNNSYCWDLYNKTAPNYTPCVQM